MDIRIEHPLWLLVLVPITVYLIFTWRTVGRKTPRTALLFILRSASILFLVAALVSPFLVLYNDEEQILFLADRSASNTGTEEEMNAFIEQSLGAKKADQAVGLYSFAGDFRTDASLTKEKVLMPEIEALEEVGETDIEKAFALANSTGPTDAATRIVLLSDGLQTRGDVFSYLQKFTNNRVQIDVAQLKRKTFPDAALTRLDVPRTAYAGQQQLMTIEVNASDRTSGTLYLYQDDRPLGEEDIDLIPGKNQFTYPLPSVDTGLVKYEAKLVVENDHFLENNRMFAAVTVQGQPSVLVVETDDHPSVIPELLDQNTLNVITLRAQDLPSTLSGYLPYQAIIFDNVPGTLVGEEKMAMIEQTVKNFGTGFMMTGGTDSFGLGGYFKTPIETLLPVEMEVKGKEELPSLGLVIVMDRSGSMSGSKLSLAREAAARSVDLLREKDTFGFTAFDDSIWEVVPVGPLDDKEDVTAKILSVPAAGGTNIFPSVAKAYEDLANLSLQRKHVILLTDGQSSMPSGYLDIIEEAKNNNTTLSTVGIGSDADQALLEAMAEAGGGRYYGVSDESTVPAILSRETITMTRTYIEDNPFHMKLGPVAEWNELFAEGVPQMNAYIATTAKQTADVAAVSPKEDPIIAEWKYGLGRTVAFTSDSSGKWSGELAAWEKYPDFWNTAMRRILPSYSSAPYVVTQLDGGKFTITDTSGESAFLEVSAVTETGEEIEVNEDQTAPGKTEITLEAAPGLVYLSVTDDQNRLFETGVTIPYGEEYSPKEPNEDLLAAIAEETGGRVLEEPKEAFRSLPYRGEERKSITTLLVFGSLLLFFADITLRRFSRFVPVIRKRSSVEPIDSPGQTSVSELLKQKRKR
ncbi:VWA domain-containing protein [Sporosarcina gallistercoris]|uniref:VWA domain-containing protein n=1 Tax=Sporosarcina gallistercoris TaxID=2762245 RepID=A0ABR8PGI8_9BACL|nr:VWA domain-containing protein [Sporosarcina gallistercoris]MBD7907281.1 VWA domain-containing protein [Sporosarcina gallistercoris]